MGQGIPQVVGKSWDGMRWHTSIRCHRIPAFRANPAERAVSVYRLLGGVEAVAGENLLGLVGGLQPLVELLSGI